MAALIIQPPYFDGQFGPAVSNWIWDFERVSEINGWDTDRLKLAAFPSYLTGLSKSWYNTCHSTTCSEYTTWQQWADEIKSTFREDFFGRLRTLEGRKLQHDELVDKYCFEKIALCRYHDVKMEDEHIIHHLVEGLPKELREKLISYSDTDLNGFRVMLRKVIRLRSETAQPTEQTPGWEKRPDEVKPSTNFDGRNYGILEPVARRENWSPDRVPSVDFASHSSDERRRKRSPTPPRRYRRWTASAYYNRETRRRAKRVKSTRTKDGRPICFNCNRPGHFARNCRTLSKNVVTLSLLQQGKL